MITARRVLLLEDDELDAELVRLKLEDTLDVALTHATGLDEALRLLASSEPFDVILTDLNLPGRDPTEVVPRIKEIAPGTGIVVLSGSDETQVGLKTVRAGAHDYLHKDNLTGDALERSLRYAVERSLVENRLKEVALRDPLTGIPNRGFFDEMLKRLVAQSQREGRGVCLLWLDLDRRLGSMCGRDGPHADLVAGPLRAFGQ